MPRISVDDSEPDPSLVEPKATKSSSDNPAPTKTNKISDSTPDESNSTNNPPLETPKHTDPVDDELRQKSGTSPFAAFFAYPSNLTFSEQAEDESIVLLLRAHLITNVPWIIITLLALLFPLIAFPVMVSLGVLPIIGASLSLVVTVFWYLGTFTYAFLNLLYWFFNVYIVTNERIVDIDWYSVVYRKVSSCQISKIQDVSATQVGALSGIFDFGDVDIQTAAEVDNFTFEKVPHPQLVSKKIQELMQKEEEQWETHPPTP